MAEVITERIFSMVITSWEHHLTPQHVHCNCEFMNWTESSVNFANLLFWTGKKKWFFLDLKLYFNLLTEAIFSFLITHFKIKKYYYHFNFYYVIFLFTSFLFWRPYWILIKIHMWLFSNSFVSWVNRVIFTSGQNLAGEVLEPKTGGLPRESEDQSFWKKLLTNQMIKDKLAD